MTTISPNYDNERPTKRLKFNCSRNLDEEYVCLYSHDANVSMEVDEMRTVTSSSRKICKDISNKKSRISSHNDYYPQSMTQFSSKQAIIPSLSPLMRTLYSKDVSSILTHGQQVELIRIFDVDSYPSLGLIVNTLIAKGLGLDQYTLSKLTVLLRRWISVPYVEDEMTGILLLD